MIISEHRRSDVHVKLPRVLRSSFEGNTTVTPSLLPTRPRLQGRELFDQSVLKNPNRADPVGLGLEVLLQCLVQDEDEPFCGMGEKVPRFGRTGHAQVMCRSSIYRSSVYHQRVIYRSFPLDDLDISGQIDRSSLTCMIYSRIHNT